MQQIIQKPMVDGFAKVWTHKGLAIFLDEVHKQFALDFSNVMLNNFIQQQAQAAAKAAELKKIVIAED
jgi:hypothetical protein